MGKQFGAKITKEQEENYSKSPNWRGGKFHNLEDTAMNINIRNIPGLLYKQFTERKSREPGKPIPVEPFFKEEFLADSSESNFIWYGHSVILMRINNKTVLIDPMLGPNASPIAPFSTKRFSSGTLEIIDELPEIDLLLLSHDHYDHLDLASMNKLMPKVKRYFVALGTKRHLVKWSAPNNKITELDWWDSMNFEGIDITFTPSRHFSGRGLKDRFRSLWGGWAIKTTSENIYFSGDGGYGKHFSEIGERLGPFDFGMMECGQYNENWHQIHMFPEESVRTTIDSKVEKAMAVHWGGFALAQHSWRDPIDRFTNEAVSKGLAVFAPKIGQQFNYNNLELQNWWEYHN